jgi:hypothetical protein
MKKNGDNLLIDMLSLLWKGGVAIYQTFSGSSQSGKDARSNFKSEFETKSTEWQEAKLELEKLKKEQEQSHK